jgi:hypothetical protein
MRQVDYNNCDIRLLGVVAEVPDLVPDLIYFSYLQASGFVHDAGVVAAYPYASDALRVFSCDFDVVHLGCCGA